MFKWIKALGVAALLAMPSVALATDSGLGVKHDVVSSSEADQLLNAVGEVSASITLDAFESITIFVSGTYSNANDNGKGKYCNS